MLRWISTLKGLCRMLALVQRSFSLVVFYVCKLDLTKICRTI